MILAPPLDLQTYEAVALVQIAQAMGAENLSWYWKSATEGTDILPASDGFRFCFDAANAQPLSRPQEIIVREGQNYAGWLAEVNGLSKLHVTLPRFSDYLCSNHRTGATPSIVICPFAAHTLLDLTRPTWKHIVRVARSYRFPVTLMGDVGHRLDEASFTEGEVFSWRPVQDKLAALANAALVIGVPNAWTWIAASFKRKAVIFYPEEAPDSFWWPWRSDDYSLILFEQKKIQIPVVLAALRKAVAIL